MKITVQTDEFVRVVKNLLNIVPTATVAYPVLEFTCDFGELTVTGGDRYLVAQESLPASHKDSARFYVHVRQMRALVQALKEPPESLTLAPEGEHLYVTGDGFHKAVDLHLDPFGVDVWSHYERLFTAARERSLEALPATERLLLDGQFMARLATVKPLTVWDFLPRSPLHPVFIKIGNLVALVATVDPTKHPEEGP